MHSKSQVTSLAFLLHAVAGVREVLQVRAKVSQLCAKCCRCEQKCRRCARSAAGVRQKCRGCEGKSVAGVTKMADLRRWKRWEAEYRRRSGKNITPATVVAKTCDGSSQDLRRFKMTAGGQRHCASERRGRPCPRERGDHER